MRNWLGLIAPILVLAVCAIFSISYMYGVSLRTAGILEGKFALKTAAKDYSEHGYVTNYGSTSYQVWLSTNVVSIAGAQYMCYITTTNCKFYGEGSLALTTNGQFIWLDATRPPKIIATNYRAPIFPPHF